jgi:hypothetical protein
LVDNPEGTRDVTVKLLKKGGQTPEYVNQSIPTQPLHLRFGPGRGTASRTAGHYQGSAWLMGSKTLLGSPFDIMYQAVRVRFNTSTPNVYFAVVHSREAVNPQVLGGTVDIVYLPTKSDDLAVSDQNTAPIYSFQTGTLKVYALGAGSAVNPGKGSLIKFQGFGSAGLGGVGFSADLYPV